MKWLLTCVALLCATVLRADPDSRRTPVVAAVEAVLPSVVNISTERMVHHHRQQRDPYLALRRRFFGLDNARPQPSLGSGVIVDRSGLVLTNDHVISRGSRIFVSLADGSRYEAVTVASDAKHDLALLRLQGLAEGQELQAIEFARPEDLMLGETVITVGNPFGYGHSVAVGILSANGQRQIPGSAFDDFLQTDAAINPGNSGGPLINLDGELIGVNQVIHSEAQNIGFAVPVKRIEQQLATWLLPSRFGLNLCGIVPETHIGEDGDCQARIARVLPDSPAAAAKLQAGMVIERVDGQPVRQAIEVSRQLWACGAGERLRLRVAGRDVALEVAELPELSGRDLARQKLKVELQQLTGRLKEALNLPYDRGLIVSDVERGSLLQRRGIQRGDILIRIGEFGIADYEDLTRAFNSVDPDEVVEMVFDRIVRRQGKVLLLRIPLSVPM